MEEEIGKILILLTHDLKEVENELLPATAEFAKQRVNRIVHTYEHYQRELRKLFTESLKGMEAMKMEKENIEFMADLLSDADEAILRNRLRKELLSELERSNK